MYRVEQQQLLALQSIQNSQMTVVRAIMETVPDVPRMHLKREKVYTFSRSVSFMQLLNSQVASVGYAFAPSLSSLPNYTDFTNLFEQWRFMQISVSFIPVYNGSVANPLYTWFDPDDDTVPTGTAEGLQTQTLRTITSGGMAVRTFTPQLSMLGAANGTVAPVYISLPGRTWSDDLSFTNKYYGVKALIPANTNIGAGVPLYNIDATVIVQCRRPK